MVIVETIYDQAGRPLGKIREDIFNAVVTLIPADGSQRLANRKWRSSNACRKAVLNLYRALKTESPPI
jgi:hypothetical protein